MTKEKQRKERKSYTEDKAKTFAEAVNSSVRKIYSSKKKSSNNAGWFLHTISAMGKACRSHCVRSFGRENAINGSVSANVGRESAINGSVFKCRILGKACSDALKKIHSLH